MSFTPARHLEKMKSSIFSELIAAKRKATQEGNDVIDLSIGSPDLPPPRVVRDTLRKGIERSDAYGYTITGIPEFHDAVANFYHRRYGVPLNPKTEVLQLMGSQDGLSHLAMAILEAGDLVLCPNPGYTVYESAITLAGGVMVPMPLTEASGYLPDLDAIPGDIADQAKMMILNYPGNPVPVLAPRAFFEQVVAFAKRHNILVVHDFAYSELVFDGQVPQSFLSIPGSKEVGVEFNSLSKSFNMAGCRIGYMIGNEEIVEILRQFKSHVDFGTFLPIQLAAIQALTAPEAEESLAAVKALYTERRDALCDGLAELGWQVSKPPATMFVWARIPAHFTSRDFTFAALAQTNVAVTPGNAFGTMGEGYVRIALVQPVSRLYEAVERLGKFLNH